MKISFKLVLLNEEYNIILEELLKYENEDLDIGVEITVNELKLDKLRLRGELRSLNEKLGYFSEKNFELLV